MRVFKACSVFRRTVPSVSKQWMRCFSLPAHTFLEMPALSPTMSEGKIISWTAKIGDLVKAGEVFCEVETDKATVAYESQEDGYLAKILIPEGTENVEVGTPIGVVVDEASEVGAFANFVLESGTTPTPAAEAPKKEDPPAAATPVTPPPREPSIKFTHTQKTPTPSPAPTGGRIIASPFAKTLAAENGVDLRVVVGTGPGGRIVAEDVRKAITVGVIAAPTAVTTMATPTPISATGVPYVNVFPIPPRTEPGASSDEPLSAMRKIIGQRLTESKMSIPHYYVSVDCELDGLMKIRTGLNKVLEKQGAKLSVNDFIIKASAYALKQVPEANSMWQGTSIRKNDFVDISVAVDTGAGLITPIVRGCESKGLLQISTDVKELVAKSKANKLLPTDYQGGTFTISNMGMMGVKSFTAIINPPQSCILAVSSAEKVLKPADNERGFRTATVMNVTLSSDHRVVDGAVAAKWCNAFKTALENPEILML